MSLPTSTDMGKTGEQKQQNNERLTEIREAVEKLSWMEIRCKEMQNWQFPEETRDGAQQQTAPL